MKDKIAKERYFDRWRDSFIYGQDVYMRVITRKRKRKKEEKMCYAEGRT